MSEHTVERQRINGVSGGANLAKLLVRTKGPDGQAYVLGDCLTTVEAVIATGLVNSSTLKKTVSESEAVKYEALDITREGEAGSWGDANYFENTAEIFHIGLSRRSLFRFLT